MSKKRKKRAAKTRSISHKLTRKRRKVKPILRTKPKKKGKKNVRSKKIQPRKRNKKSKTAAAKTKKSHAKKSHFHVKGRKRRSNKTRLPRSIVHVSRKTKIRRVKGTRKTQLKFLTKNGIKHDAYILNHRVRIVDGDFVVGINAHTLRQLVNNFISRFNRGLPFARIIINYSVGRGRGKLRVIRAVGTSRIPIEDTQDWLKVLSSFNDLSLRLFDGDSDKLTENETGENYKIINVVLELINLDLDRSVDVKNRTGKKS